MSDSVIELRDVMLQKGHFRLEVPVWQVQPGRVVGVVGPNGAGKTSLLRLLPGLDGPAAGTVSVLGATPSRRPDYVRSNLGYADDLLVLNDGEVLRSGETNKLVADGTTLEEAMIAWGADG